MMDASKYSTGYFPVSSRYCKWVQKDHIEKPSDVLKVGDEVTAKVVDFNGEEKKISLSMKALEPAAEEAAEEE